MRLNRVARITLLAAALVFLMAAPAGSTTLIRSGLETLTADNAMIVQGKVLEIHSYWNADRTFIFTDVRFQPTRVLKGDRAQREITFTLMGGTVGEITTLIVANPDLAPGSEYLLFLNREELPAATERVTVRDLAQGAFDIVRGRAVSQAIHHPLLPDSEGRTDPPGGRDGLAVRDIVDEIGRIVGDR
jgi:hypothetical protein